jgi:hypothetical protein
MGVKCEYIRGYRSDTAVQSRAIVSALCLFLFDPDGPGIV